MIESVPYKKPGILWIPLGIPFIFIIGSLMHFTYDWSGQQTVVGIFSPVNESIWEHLKMVYWPTLLWWVLGFLVFYKKEAFPTCLWFFSCSISLIISPLFIVSFYYTYTGALGIHFLFLDILSMLLGIIVAQLLALHIYRYSSPICPLYCLFAFIVIFILMAAFISFTFNPPQLPLFLDSSTGTYGI